MCLHEKMDGAAKKTIWMPEKAAIHQRHLRTMLKHAHTLVWVICMEKKFQGTGISCQNEEARKRTTFKAQ